MTAIRIIFCQLERTKKNIFFCNSRQKRNSKSDQRIYLMRIVRFFCCCWLLCVSHNKHFNCAIMKMSNFFSRTLFRIDGFLTQWAKCTCHLSQMNRFFLLFFELIKIETVLYNMVGVNVDVAATKKHFFS